MSRPHGRPHGWVLVGAGGRWLVREGLAASRLRWFFNGELCGDLDFLHHELREDTTRTSSLC